MAKSTKRYFKKEARPSKRFLNTYQWAIPGNMGVARERIKIALDSPNLANSWFPELTQMTILQLELYELRYWRNFFIIKSRATGKRDPAMEYAKKFIIDALWFSSGVGIKWDPHEKKPLVYWLTMYWLNPYFKIQRANGLIYSYPADYTKMDQFWSLMTRQNMTSDTTAMILSNPNGLPWAYGVRGWAYRWEARFNSGDINVANSINVKGISTNNIAGNRIKEIVKFQGGRSPLQIIKGPFDQIVDLSLENNSKEIWHDIDKLKQYYEWERGMRGNFDFKKERNVADEIGKNDMSFIIMEADKFVVLQDLMDQLNEIAGTDFYIDTVINDYQINEQQIEAIPEVIKAEANKESTEKLNENEMR